MLDMLELMQCGWWSMWVSGFVRASPDIPEADGAKDGRRLLHEQQERYIFITMGIAKHFIRVDA
jgi:hypothetical protein